ncbi:MAG TPA: GGDEF domain-containing protein [Gallionella sp.]
MIDTPEILRLLARAPLFHNVPLETLRPLCDKVKLVSLLQGDKLLSLGKINEHIYIVVSGRLSVKVSLSSLDEPIAMLAPGDCVGEMSVLVDGLASAHVIAITNCDLISIDYTSFWHLIDHSSEVARNMLKILVQRIHMGNETMANSILHRNAFPDRDITDNLTGLYNYHGIHLKYDRLLQRCVVDKQPVSLIVLEVDEQEKPAGNDEFRSDQILHTVAQTILTILRPDDHSARLIGMKFAVLLANVSLADARITAERLRTTINHAPILLPNGKSLPPVTVSAGVSEASPTDSWGALVARSDMALDQAIIAGGNRVV